MARSIVSHTNLGRPPIGRIRRIEPTALHRCLSSSSDPLVIVGGGPSGLFMSILLSQYNVPNILLERQTTQSRFRHPQAHFLNTRTMELLQYHLPKSTHEELLRAIPPVEHWKYFRFTHSMSAEPLAQVIHPVDRPLQANVDTNGVLVGDSMSGSWSSQDSDDRFLSPCSVGHLAQHTFCKILFGLASRQEQSEIRYGTAVTSVRRDSASQQMTVECSDGSTYTSPLVIAADGAQSVLRSQQTIPWNGQHGMQHLMNIHVTLDPKQASNLHRGNNHAMLYSIFNEHVVAMVVCHSVGDYIVQIPFFPPYQTIQDDFSAEKLETILKSIFGHRVLRWTVQSAKPWIMSSMIAQRYHADGVALVGDAAHVFPPAGGFGMNTGLQDTHNLAWKLAECHHSSERSVEDALNSYERERQPVAQQNAALSVRNYQRLLQVTESCYLNEKHPNLLVRLLDSSPLPLAGKQALFRSLFQAALLPLSFLGSNPDSLYAKHVRGNLQKVLREGAGLPLLFPRHELSFQYGAPPSVQHWKQDTVPVPPEIAVGKLLPHVKVEVVSNASDYPRLRFDRLNCNISTSNLPAQVARTARPTFVVLVVGSYDVSLVNELRRVLVDHNLSLEVVWLNSDAVDDEHADLVLSESDSVGATFSFQKESPCIVLIRPDAHISMICNELSPQDFTHLLEAAMESFQSDSVQ